MNKHVCLCTLLIAITILSVYIKGWVYITDASVRGFFLRQQLGAVSGYVGQFVIKAAGPVSLRHRV